MQTPPSPSPEISDTLPHSSEVDGTSDQTGTRTPPSTSSTASTVAVTPMELALQELKTTIDEAEQYRKSQQQHPQHLKSHISALTEDAEMLAAFQTADDALRTEATQTVFEARRLKRHIERALIDLEIDQGKQNSSNSNVKTDEKSSGLKLPPLKLPEFGGEVSQFLVFRNFFEENILKNTALTDTAKWLRLKESLIGPAAELISELPQTPHTLQVAWKLLVQVYGGDDKPIVELYDRLQRLPPALNQTTSLRLTYAKLEGILLSLEHLGHNVDENQFVRWVVLSKYPPEMMYQVPQKKNASLQELRSAIADVIAIREAADYHRTEVTSDAKKRIQKPAVVAPRSNVVAGSSTETTAVAKTLPFRPRNCVFCSDDHWNDSCPAYVTAATRKQRIAGKCFKCLQPTHGNAKCTNVKRCFHCESYEHNRALCPTKFPDEETRNVPTLIVAEEKTNRTGYFLTFVTSAVAEEPSKEHEIRVVVDTAGGATLIRRAAAETLGLKCAKKKKVTYTGLNNAHLAEGYQLDTPVKLLMKNETKLVVYPAVVDTILQEIPVPDLQRFRIENPDYAHCEIPPTGDGQSVDLLLGSDAIIDLLIPEKIINVNEDTFLVPTKVGWLILGRRSEQHQRVCQDILLTFVHNPIKLMSDVEFVGLTHLQDSSIEEEQAAIQHFYKTVTFVDGRYSISWPWRNEPPNLDTNYGLALGRLKTLYKRLQNTPQLLQEYHQIILEQEKDGVIEKVALHRKIEPYLHYLPHHPVIQPEKSTSVRLVYDGAATAGPKKLSLNDNILKGTKWLNDLIATLIRFRKDEIALTADIAKAFHQIAINESDRDVVRFVWLKEPNQPPSDTNLQVYRFKRVAFGIIASPFILHAVIKFHADKQKSSPFLEKLLRDLYADNLVTTLQTANQAAEFYSYTKTFFASMAMNLTKWTSNDEHTRQCIPQEDQLTDIVQPVLGLKWNTKIDRLTFKMPKLHTDNHPTRRTVAKGMASMFDPLGWAIPVILLAKIFFRKIWTKTEKWDQRLDEGDRAEWLQILNKLREMEIFYVPRRMCTLPLTDIQLHTFVDSSMQAYAVVSYITVSHGGETQQSIVAARNRLTPKKQLTIPKLELAALVLGCRFTKFVRDSLRIDAVTTHIWSDSKCVLAWVQQKRLLPAIINRYVEEALSYGVNEFHYVPSQMNYADIATRGASLAELTQIHWWDGPTWLKNSEDWPMEVALPQPVTETAMLIFRDRVCDRREIKHEDEVQGVATLKISSFSSLTKLLRVTAICVTAVQKILKQPVLRIEKDLDLHDAERRWLYWDQKREYALSDEIDAGKIFNLHNVGAFRDADGLIRCRTRLANAAFDTETVNPVLLVKNSTLTKLIILQTHTLSNHAGTSYTLAKLRKRFWLPHGRRQVYSVILSDCYRCRRQLAQPYSPPPPIPLPDFRVLRTQKPFQVIGMDIFGPNFVHEKKGRSQPKQKVWGIIFTCAVIRAIHIEILEDMTTEEITLAFRRFISRRGVPYQIISDNAPQFHELDGCLANLWKTVAKNTRFSNYLSDRKIDWKFVTDTSPWMGGFYERLIRTVKSSLEFTYGDIVMSKRQFATVLVEIEGIVNARPISYVDRELESPIITPSDFLTATFVSIPIQNVPTLSSNNIEKLWRSSQQTLEQFWQHWADQYLLMLRDRHDQLQPRNNHTKRRPEKGDIVVMVDVSKKRSHWQTAVVERLIKSKDNEIRSVQIRIANGARLIRPIISLAPLKLKMDLPNVLDEQLSKKRDTITVWPREGAVQEIAAMETEQIGENSERAMATERRREQNHRESRAGGEGGGIMPYHSNELESELGLMAAELEACETSSSAAHSNAPGSVVESHEVPLIAVRGRSELASGNAEICTWNTGKRKKLEQE